jgi:penicillin-binding protein 1C
MDMGKKSNKKISNSFVEKIKERRKKIKSNKDKKKTREKLNKGRTASLSRNLLILTLKTILFFPRLVLKALFSKKTKEKNEKSVKKFDFKKFFGLFLLIASLSGMIGVWLFWDVPSPTQLSIKQIPVSTKIFDRFDNLIYEIYTDTRRTPVVLEDLPQHLIYATIAIEDQEFYKHKGVSFTGITRAAYNTVFKQKLQGGSTLTQQLVKNSLLTPERTVVRKVREIFLTLMVEVMYSKEQILSMYLNQIPYGSTAYGIGAAAELYFNKNASELTLAESALLAGMTAAPTKFSPFGTNPGSAKQRQNIVLQRMVDDGYITADEAEKASGEELIFATPKDLKAPHFALWIKELLAEKYGHVVVEQGGLRVKTTLDLELQEFAQASVATEVAKLKNFQVGNGAALVTRPGSGEILAMVGSKDYFAEDEDGKVNIVFSKRQPGSSIKPINYALGIKDKKISASTPIADVPTCFGVAGQSAYCPRNYDGIFHGATHVRFALGNSYNIPAVRVLALNGVENFVDFARSMGIKTFQDPRNYGLSLTLGGGEVRPFDMATAFGVFANSGERVELNPILEVRDWQGNILEKNDPDNPKKQLVLDEGVSFIISHILSDNSARSSAFGTGSFLNVRNHPEVSVKTGTTNDLKDNWTIGYTKHALVVTWVGNNDSSPMSRAVSGVSGASPIWNAIMREVLEKAEDGHYNKDDEGHAGPKQPESVIGTNVCNTSGNRPDNPDEPGCETRFEYFLKDKIGAGIEAGNTDVLIDIATQTLAHPELPPELTETQNRPFLLDPLGTMVCLDCEMQTHYTTITYPLIMNINTN